MPSPVRNLREWSDSINHEAFVGAVVGEFKDAYGGESEVHVLYLILMLVSTIN